MSEGPGDVGRVKIYAKEENTKVSYKHQANKESEPRSTEIGSLQQLLAFGLQQRGLTIDDLADRTKVPRSTIRSLLGSTEPAILPQRVYLRGHVGVLAKDLGVDMEDAFSRFDIEQPAEPKFYEEPDMPRVNRASMAAAAALGGIGIIAVILAFAS